MGHCRNHKHKRNHLRPRQWFEFKHSKEISDMSGARHSDYVFCVTQQTCLLCNIADMSDV